MSALLVALIVDGDLQRPRRRDQNLTPTSAGTTRPAVLAAQSQEQLRSEPASALDTLETNPHKYTRTVGGTIYTVTQEAKPAGHSGAEETPAATSREQIRRAELPGQLHRDVAAARKSRPAAPSKRPA